MRLLDFFKRKSDAEKEKEELLKGLSLFGLKYIAKAKNIYTSELETKDNYIDAILKKGVSKSFIEECSEKAQKLEWETKKISPTESGVRKVIENWTPKKGQGHNELKNDLYLQFKKKFGDEYVRKESGEYHADIVIDKRIPIELKVNFGGKAERNRLSGQITDYKKNYKGTIFLVICGINKLDDAWGEIKPQLDKDRRIETIVKYE